MTSPLGAMTIQSVISTAAGSRRVAARVKLDAMGMHRDAVATGAPMSTKRRETLGIVIAPALAGWMNVFSSNAGSGKRRKY